MLVFLEPFIVVDPDVSARVEELYTERNPDMELWEQPVEVRIMSAQGSVQQKIAHLAARSRSNQDSH